MGGDALGPVKTRCPQVRDCQCQEADVGGLVPEQGEKDWLGDFSEGKQGKGIKFEIYNKKIQNVIK